MSKINKICDNAYNARKYHEIINLDSTTLDDIINSLKNKTNITMIIQSNKQKHFIISLPNLPIIIYTKFRNNCENLTDLNRSEAIVKKYKIIRVIQVKGKRVIIR